MAVALLIGVLAVWCGLLAPRAQAAPPAQTASAVDAATTQHIYLLPAEAAGVSVEVHIVELWISASGAATVVDVDATYRLRNPERAAASPLIRLAPAAGNAGVTQLAHISNVSLTSNDAAVGLQETENGNYTARVEVPADGRLPLRLRYRVTLGRAPLVTLRYAMEPLNRWPGEISIRVEAKIPDAIAADSWTRVEPDGWSYGVATDPGRVDVKWLYNRRAPETPIIFQFANLEIWQQIRALELTPSSSRSFEQFNRLGELYRQLYNAAGALEGHPPGLSERFLAQVIAAYSAALAAPGANDADRGAIHYNLAQLYRTHAPFAPPERANEYANLVVNEVTAAIELLPPGDARRAEMGRWQADGLTLLLSQARAAQEWDRALAIVDELETLPPESVNQELIEEERAHLLIQKALELLEAGNREAAFAVAGPQLAGAQLEPPDQMQTLFLRWALTVTTTPSQLNIVALGQTAPQRHDAAMGQAQDMVALFTAGTTRRSSEVQASVVEDDWDGEPALALHIHLPNGTNTAFLASLTPATVEWILLRTLLGQLSIEVAEQHGLLWRRITLNQPLDLRPASTQWTSMANSLARQAEEFEAAAQAAGESQDALAARIRAVHYRAAAEQWRELGRQSRLYFEFQIGGATLSPSDPALAAAGPGVTDKDQTAAGQAIAHMGAPLTRAWYTAVSGPSQVFTMQAQLLNMARLLTLIIVAFSGILAVAGLLWWLL